MKSTISSDVVVVGAGNAALCAALAANEAGASVTVLERAPIKQHGGNTSFTGGGYRCSYDGDADMIKLMPDLTENEKARTDFGSYTKARYYDDIGNVTDYRADPDLVEVLVENSFDTCYWLTSQGIHFIPAYKRHATGFQGRFRFGGGVVLEVSGGGSGVVEGLMRTAEGRGVNVIHDARAYDLEIGNSRVEGVHATIDGERTLVKASKGVVLGCGGFEASAEQRVRYLGTGWELAKVRGTRYNTGDGLRMALDAGAMAYGNWSGCHAVSWGAEAPSFGDHAVGDSFSRHSYPLGITVNRDGQRFYDEGEDWRTLTYATLGRKILQQPGQVAWQIFDSKPTDFFRALYKAQNVQKVVGDTVEELAARLEPEGLNSAEFLRTLTEYNRAVKPDGPNAERFDPDVKDGRCTVGLDLKKSNWAVTIDEGPFEAFMVTPGITFTFGGVKINPDGSVVDCGGDVIDGLYACGEMVGGVFYYNYPGGAGLMSGAVFGRIAGQSAAS